MARGAAGLRAEAEYASALVRVNDGGEDPPRRPSFSRVPGRAWSPRRTSAGTPRRTTNPEKLLIDAPEGVIRLWARDVTLGWRFQDQSMTVFKDPNTAREAIRRYMSAALSSWGEDVLQQLAEQHGSVDSRSWL